MVWRWWGWWCVLHIQKPNLSSILCSLPYEEVEELFNYYSNVFSVKYKTSDTQPQQININFYLKYTAFPPIRGFTSTHVPLVVVVLVVGFWWFMEWWICDWVVFIWYFCHAAVIIFTLRFALIMGRCTYPRFEWDLIYNPYVMLLYHHTKN